MVKSLEYLTNIDNYRTVKISKVEEETSRVHTLTFKDELCNRAKAGQYIMLWIQGVDEIPLSLSTINRKGLTGVTVERVGEATTSLLSKKVGDFVKIRGPYGNSFDLVKGNILLVGGGVGTAPLLPLLDDFVKIGSRITFIMGVKTRSELFSFHRIKAVIEILKGSFTVTTDDGSYGEKGLATDPVKSLLTEKHFDMVYTCGPEQMMRSVFEMADNAGVKVQACFERIIRCSLGLCGSCVIGEFRVCRDGPVFSTDQVRKVLDEFGRYKRDFDGSRIRI